MKRVFHSILFVLIVCTSSDLFATIRRVDSNAGNGAPYTTIAAAVAAANAGDTIQVAGAAIPYAGASIAKQLVLIGPGYFLGENPQTQNNKSPARINSSITFAAGSNGSFIMGFQLEGTDIISLATGVSNIVIKRNYFTSTTRGIQFNATFNAGANSNILVQQNYFTGIVWDNSYLNTNTGISLLNNYIGGTIDGLESSNLIIKNNVVKVSGNAVFSGTLANSTIQNNIFIFGTTPSATGLGGSNSFTNNLCDETIFGTSNSNQASVNMATVFVLDPAAALPLGTSQDGRWKLAAGSPALAAGFAGEDCGMYGGTDPYVLSGIPPVPAIYELIVPSSATQSGGLNVTVKAKTHQ